MTPLATYQNEAASTAKLSRRGFLKRASLGAGVLAIGLAGYSGLIEPNVVDITRLDLKLNRLSAAFDGFKIALISDLHYGPYTGEHEIGAAVHAANDLKPDIVFLLGDFVTEPLIGHSHAGAKNAEPCATLLGGLQSQFGSFAVLGNHDYATNPELVAEGLLSHRINLLRNANHPLERDGARLWLVGMNDAMFGKAALEQGLRGIPPNEPKVLLVHEPDFADEASRYGIDAQFSGHSHGGQIRFPGVHPFWLPDLAKKYYRGYYRVGNLQLYTNRGIGTVAVPFRFCAPPEVTLVTLRSV